VAVPYAKFLQAFSVAIAALMTATSACDPNVIIGRRLRAVTTAGTDSGNDFGGGAGVVSGGGVAAVAGALAEGGSTAGESTLPVAGEPDAGGGQVGDPGLIFSADNEGSLAQWDQGLADDGGYYSDAGMPAPVADKAEKHSGDYSALAYIDTTAGDHISRLYRRIYNREAYYSAWFYLAEDHTPSNWWSIFLFRANQDRNNSDDLWSVNIARTKDKKALTVALFDHHAAKTINVPEEPLVPVGVWFQIQAYLIQEVGKPSKLSLWLDGKQFLQLDSTTPVPAGQPVYWVIGNGGSTMSPPKSYVYVDDAQISTSFVRP
jgi:hypothetical protein